ncbi:hypothetical protein EC991_002247 [Linnemannia zychae]|nr:hypothetical protein EC991_002247 [Linnemannia zychae]
MPSASLPPMLPFESPSVKEINMRRLMAKCDAKVHADRILQGSERSKYLMSIKTLEGMLAELEQELSRSGRIDQEAIKGYADKIEALASAVGGTTPKQQAHAQVEPVSQLRDRRSDRNELYGNNNQNSLGITTGRSNGAGGSNSSNTQTARGDQAQVEAALQNDRAAREEMEAGLSALMQQLRHNALAIQQTLVDEQKSGLFDDADQALDTNISRLGKERARLELYSKQSRKTKWMIWGIVLGVSLVFVFMFFIIRIF